MTRLALYQPDIPQNLGTIMRLCACMDTPLDIIEPCSFLLNEKKMLRAGMDYVNHVDYTRHRSWDAFKQWRTESSSHARIILFTTKTNVEYQDFQYKDDDILLFGRESAGVPQEVVEYANDTVIIPMKSDVRSLNVALSAAMGLAEALRQTTGFPKMLGVERDETTKSS